MVSPEERTYFGLDCSTQQLKGIVVDDSFNILHQEIVEFDSVLPEFRTQKGVIHSRDGKTILSPTIMWVKALDILLDKLQVAGADFAKVASICGTAQQHGTVFWQKGSENTLKNLDPSNFLHTQLATCFTVPNSPVWMDSSTKKYCKLLEDVVGGAVELAKITGSTAYERFSGSQIAKIADTKKIAYDNTERISLVSSFMATLFLGKYAPIDFADGSGMNLLDLRNKCWNRNLLETCGPNLAEKIGKPVPSDTDLGAISRYFVERFAFNSNCRIVSFTGDNPASLVGLRLTPDDVGVSLGTSDTLFLWLKEPKLLPQGHLFVNPIDENDFMALLCYKNGSLTRERFRDEFANRSWDEFEQMVDKTPRGNFGYMGLFFDEQEILPWVRGDFRFDKMNNLIKKFPSPETDVRAVVEGQFIAKRAHAEDLGFSIDSNTKLIASGGASRNVSVLQCLADIFNAPVYRQEALDSAVLGAAYMAKQGIRNRETDLDSLTYFEKITSSVPAPKLICTPYSDSNEIYPTMVVRYRELMKKILDENLN